MTVKDPCLLHPNFDCEGKILHFSQYFKVSSFSPSQKKIRKNCFAHTKKVKKNEVEKNFFTFVSIN